MDDIENRASYGRQLRIVRLIAHISEEVIIRLLMAYGEGMATVETSRKKELASLDYM
jgi:hypothetical protein